METGLEAERQGCENMPRRKGKGERQRSLIVTSVDEDQEAK